MPPPAPPQRLRPQPPHHVHHALLMAVEGEMSGPGLARVRKCAEALVKQGLVVKLGKEAYARRGAVEDPKPTAALELVRRHIPEVGSIGVGDLTLLVMGTGEKPAWRLTMQRLRRLMDGGWVWRVGRGRYVRKGKQGENVKENPQVAAFLERLRAG